MRTRERAEQIIELRRCSLTHEDWIVAGEQIIEAVIQAATEEERREWAHSLETAIEEHFPLPRREWREWPCVPEIEVVCEWFNRAVNEVRMEERETCARIAEDWWLEQKEDDYTHGIASAIRARGENNKGE